MRNIWRDGIYGLAVGDALGVPVEFTSREERKADPVMEMRGYGTHDQPAGTWSDDTSMVLATLDSIDNQRNLDRKDMMKCFSDWCLYGEYTPFREVFDIGNATRQAILRYGQTKNLDECGGRTEYDNGNGSLMRILPVCLFLFERQKKICTSEDECIYKIHAVSTLTHANLRSQMACGIYYFCVEAVLEQQGSLIERLQKGIDQAYEYYRHDLRNYAQLQHFQRLMHLEKFRELPEMEISSSGYVVDTLEAAIWCLIQTDSFEEALIMAVNLGDDTDTVGAVTGGLAGLYYGYEKIPQEWLDALQKKDMIEKYIIF